MKAKIVDIEYFLPEQVLTNEMLKKENPDWDMDLLVQKTGIEKRFVTGEDETALDLAFEACKKLFNKRPELKKQIDGLIFCCQHEDYQLPRNACLLHGKLGLSEDVFTLDVGMGCSGFVYCLGVCHGLICANICKNILLVNSDTIAKLIHKKDRSIRVLFGDGAAVTWITASTGSEGLIDIQCSNSGKHFDAVIIPGGRARNPSSVETKKEIVDESKNIRTLENVYVSGKRAVAFINTRMPKQIKRILKRNHYTLEDIDLFVFHPGSKIVTDSIQRLLQIDPTKMFINAQNTGNLTHASVPIALKGAMDLNKVQPGDKVLLSAYGTGMSYATAIIRI
ncbi:3-oxoacyl-ACP synthase [Candidatus Magnetomorum sp. HK-1]|nr:3-oxoacyl-ACP synthase [Candidatus Magnetomorum sp. HK-1]